RCRPAARWKCYAGRWVPGSGRPACRSGSPPPGIACGGSSAARPGALTVALAVEGRRAATGSTLAGAIGLLVIPLRDGVRDPAGAQRGPVGPAGVRLV